MTVSGALETMSSLLGNSQTAAISAEPNYQNVERTWISSVTAVLVTCLVLPSDNLVVVTLNYLH